ncbi:Gx transporter family protein [Clostridium sediminicola]|uniref:Gx transporter family protein n=1 Tax=Clostridium sediminicola TaxID=3114879 RepID=UPI0031F1E181
MDCKAKKTVRRNMTRKIVLTAVLVAQAIVLSAIERIIPFPSSVPGVKLGLGNIISLTAIYLFSFKESLSIVLLKTIMATFILGSFSTFIYSLSGAILSFFVMFVLYVTLSSRISTIGISVAGAISHNLGQLLMAALIIKNINVVAYLPVLMMSGIGTGIVVGITTNYLLKYLKKTKLFDD